MAVILCGIDPGKKQSYSFGGLGSEWPGFPPKDRAIVTTDRNHERITNEAKALEYKSYQQYATLMRLGFCYFF